MGIEETFYTSAVDRQLFHERKQGSQESVDDFAEELRHLLAKAYGSRSQGTPEAESMGEIILANQFVAGLLPGLKARVVGSDRTLEQLLLKARFENAKAKQGVESAGQTTIYEEAKP